MRTKLERLHAYGMPFVVCLQHFLPSFASLWDAGAYRTAFSIKYLGCNQWFKSALAVINKLNNPQHTCNNYSVIFYTAKIQPFI